MRSPPSSPASAAPHVNLPPAPPFLGPPAPPRAALRRSPRAPCTGLTCSEPCFLAVCASLDCALPFLGASSAGEAREGGRDGGRVSTAEGEAVPATSRASAAVWGDRVVRCRHDLAWLGFGQAPPRRALAALHATGHPATAAGRSAGPARCIRAGSTARARQQLARRSERRTRARRRSGMPCGLARAPTGPARPAAVGGPAGVRAGGMSEQRTRGRCTGPCEPCPDESRR